MIEALANIIRFAPLLSLVLTLLGGTIGSGVVAWNVQQWKFDTFDKPAAERAQRAADVAEFQKAAADAKARRELEIFKFIERSTQTFYEQQTEDEAWHQARLFALQQEIQAYEQDPENKERCTITERIRSYVLGADGLRAEQGPAGRGP